jgi:biotin carboxylase
VATLLFLGASVSQLPAIRHARTRGHRVVAVDGDPRAVAFPVCHVAEPVDFSDVDRVAAIGARHRVDGVLAISSDRAVVPAAVVAERLGLPGIGSDVARAMTDKSTMRSRLARAAVPQPRHAAVSDEPGLRTAASEIGFPAVLKPADSGGQRGLFLVGDASEAARRLPETLAFARAGVAMLEEYVDGAELNALLVVRGGRPTLVALSDRLRPEGPGFGVGWIHSFPSSLPAHTLAEAQQVAFAAVGALGLQDGIAFPQLIADGTGAVRIVEIAARIAAGQMADLVRLGTGIDLFDVAFAQAIGDPVPDALVTPTIRRPIAIRFLTARPGVLPVGTVTAVEGLDAVRASPGVLAADVYFAPGATIGPLRVDADRSGYVIATADTPRRALALADRAASSLVARTTAGVRRRHGPRSRLARVVPVAAAFAIAAAAALAFLLTGNANLDRALLTGPRIDEQLSPVCHCPHDVAHVAFHVVRGGRVTVQIVDAGGRPVQTLLHDTRVRPGWLRFAWSGRTALGRLLPNGSYRLQVTLPQRDRTLRLPGSIVVDSDRPRLLHATFRRRRSRILVRYAFSEPAHGLLLIDGRRAAFTRTTARTGELTWTPSDGIRRPAEPARAALLAVDPAGNASRPSRTYVVPLT